MVSGLTELQAQKILKQQGPNEIPQKKVTLLSKIIKDIFSPISGMLILASLLSFFIGKVFDGSFILILLVLNIAIAIWQEGKADNAIAQLNKDLAQKVEVIRDGVWKYIDSRKLVPGDVIQLSAGEVVPIDGKIIEINRASFNESALTGESLPKDKRIDDMVYSGSFLATGTVMVQVVATGSATKFGKTIMSVDTSRKKSLLEKDIINISKFLTVLSLIAVAVLSVIFILEKAPYLELLTLNLSLIIAGIPISLPTIMTLIIEIGVLNLAKKKAIVRRLSALEDFANVNFLLTDKTGTLTKNKITINEVFGFGKFTEKQVLTYAGIGASLESESPISQAIEEKINSLKIGLPKFSKLDFIPFDSDRKRSTSIIKKADKQLIISLGAPQIIQKFCLMTKDEREIFNNQVDMLAKKGYRTLAVGMGKNPKEKGMHVVGLMSLSDELRSDAKDVVRFLQESGMDVAMVTGDNQAIARQIAQELNIDGKIITKSSIDDASLKKMDKDYFSNVSAFAEVLPEDKLHLVEQAKQFFVVAANGDGINDLPAIKAANVGIAVKSAVQALKAAADIVFASEGISVFKDAITESRKIFERIYSYSVYRISESFRLIVTIAILGILYRVYPLTPLQIILIALLNDIPIISLAFDRVEIAKRPATINAKKRLTISTAFGMVGVVNSLALFYLTNNIWHLDWNTIQTMFFLKLSVSGHLLIYVAHTKKLWFKFLPSKQVIWATTLTQLIATVLALTGFLMPSNISLANVIFIWIWAIFWMFVAEVVKHLQTPIAKKTD